MYYFHRFLLQVSSIKLNQPKMFQIKLPIKFLPVAATTRIPFFRANSRARTALWGISWVIGLVKVLSISVKTARIFAMSRSCSCYINDYSKQVKENPSPGLK